MLDWWSANGEAKDLQFKFAEWIEQRIFDSRPSPYPVPKGSSRMVKFLGMAVLIDDRVPKGEIHIVDHHGKQTGKIAGLDSV